MLWNEIEPKIRPTVEKLANRQREDLPKVLVIGGLLSAPALGFVFSVGRGAFLVIGTIVALVVCLGGVYAIFHYFRNQDFKEKVVPTIVEAICPGATYSAKGTFDKNIIQNSRLYDMRWGEIYRCEDTIRGKVDKTDFVYSEVRLSHMQSSGKATYEVIDFQGFAFEADFNKYFNGTTVVTTQRFSLTGKVGFLSDLQRIHMEDPRFEKTYTTYATDDQEARYILSPALMERILSMHESFRTQLGDEEISISFNGSRMLIMVPSKTDRFEVKYDMEGVKKDVMAFALLVDIVNQLNLNLRIWTKE